MSKYLKESMKMISHQIENKDIKFFKESNRDPRVEKCNNWNVKFPKGAWPQIWAGRINNSEVIKLNNWDYPSWGGKKRKMNRDSEIFEISSSIPTYE